MMASYVLRTVERGFLAFAFTNTGPKILSHHGAHKLAQALLVCIDPFFLNNSQASDPTSEPIPSPLRVLVRRRRHFAWIWLHA